MLDISLDYGLSRIKTFITNVAKSAVNFLTKKIELPVLSKIKNKNLNKA